MLRQLKPLTTRILPKEAKAFLKKHVFKGKLPGLAIKYLRGDGIEIGGLSAPTPVSRGVRVRFVEDFKVYLAGDLVTARERNRGHYIEFGDIFDKNARGHAYVKPSPEERQRLIDEHVEKQYEIHFHTFTLTSYTEFLNYFCQSVDPSMAIAEVVENDVKVIGVLRKAS